MWSDFASSGIFYAIAGIIILFALLSVTLRNIFHSALSLIAALLGVAAVYIYLDAEFLALLQALIYVGAIMTLIIFGIMLTLKISDKGLRQHNRQKFFSFLISGAMAALLISIFIGSNFKKACGIQPRVSLEHGEVYNTRLCSKGGVGRPSPTLGGAQRSRR